MLAGNIVRLVFLNKGARERRHYVEKLYRDDCGDKEERLGDDIGFPRRRDQNSHDLGHAEVAQLSDGRRRD